MIVLLMGVSGSGKTTVGKLLANNLGWKFEDADGFHSPANIKKMSQGIPLTDEDRQPWLASMASAIRDWLKRSENVILACSALKQKYRDRLLIDPQVKLVYLRGSFDLILSRMQQRGSHYMRPDMLRSQFEALEEPQDALTVDITPSPADIAREIDHRLFGPAV
jgi:gluconokinase